MIVSLSMVQSEADIIEYFIRSNITLFDHMFVVLNPSEDGTGDILYSLVREGLPLTVWPTPRNHYAQSEILTALTNRIRDQLDPDYLCLIDADEIILAESREAFLNSLAQIVTGSVGLMPWMTFIPPSNELDYVFNPEQWNDRLEQEIHQFYKIVIPRGAAYGQDVIIPNGQHIAMQSKGEYLPTTILADVALAHLPVRSIPQIRAKTFGSIISKGLAQGVAWRGSESYQRQTVLSYFETNAAPDSRHIARLYLAKDWQEYKTPQSVKDYRLPRVPQSLNHLIQKKPPELQLLHRIMHAVYPLNDPTDTLARPNVVESQEQNPTAIFSSAFHLQHLKCDWPPFDYVFNRFRPSAVLDVGCGLGAYLALFRNAGAKVTGIDGAPWSSNHFLSQIEYIQVDLASDLPKIGRNFSVSIFVEVAEHPPEAATFAIIDQLTAKTSDAVVFSAAQPNQPGYGHITLRVPDFWLQRFRRAGWEVDVPGSISLRMLSTLHWFRRNLFLLVRGGKHDASGFETLLRLGVHRDRNGGNDWPTHRSGETIIGFPGQRWSFNMTGDREIPPLAGGKPA